MILLPQASQNFGSFHQIAYFCLHNEDSLSLQQKWFYSISINGNHVSNFLHKRQVTQPVCDDDVDPKPVHANRKWCIQLSFLFFQRWINILHILLGPWNCLSMRAVKKAIYTQTNIHRPSLCMAEMAVALRQCLSTQSNKPCMPKATKLFFFFVNCIYIMMIQSMYRFTSWLG